MGATTAGTGAGAVALLAGVGMAIAGGFLLPGTAPDAAASVGARVPVPATASGDAGRGVPVASIPVAFVENAGQWDARAQYGARVRGATAFVAGNSLVLASASPSADGGTVTASASVVFAGARDDLRFRGDAELAGRVNYLVGSDEATWHRGIGTWSSLRCDDAWPGIDVTLGISGRSVEYGFRIAAGADASAVSLEFPGARRVFVDPLGDLVVESAAGVMRHSRPIAWQTVEGDRRTVAVAFAPAPRGRVGIALGTHDVSLPVVVDPTVDFASYFGGGDEDDIKGVALASDGDLLLVGVTESLDLPVTGGVYSGTKSALRDAFVTRVQAGGGSLVWSTFLGGNQGDHGLCLAYSAAQGLIGVGGKTNSTDFPVAGTPFQGALAGADDGFLVLIDAASGSSLTYASYYGDTGADSINDVEVVYDPFADDELWMAAGTVSGGTMDFSTLAYPSPNNSFGGGVSDAFLAGVSGAGAVTRVGGYFGGSGDDAALGLAANSTGGLADSRVWFTGFTTGGLPVSSFGYQISYQGGASDAYLQVMTLTSGGGAFLSSDFTYLGGTGADTGTDVVLDALGRPHVCGGTTSTGFPQVNSLFTHRGGTDIFLARFADATAIASLQYSTLIGGSGSESAARAAIDLSGAIYMTGRTTTAPTDFNTLPITGAGSDGTLGGSADAFLLKIQPLTNSIRYLTYLGGASDETGQGIAVSAVGLCAVGGFTNSVAFPTVAAYDASYNGGVKDGFFAQVSTTSIALTLTSGRIDEFKDAPAGPGPNKDQFIAKGKYTGALTFTPASDAFHVVVGPVDQLHAVNIPAGSPGWSGTGAKHTWKGTVLGRLWNVQLDTAKKTFCVKITKTNFDAGDGLNPSDAVVVILEPGTSEGTNVSLWPDAGVFSSRADMVLVNP